MVDWDTLTWTPGALTNSFDVDSGNAGNDVTVSVSGDTAALTTSLVTGTPMTPAITRGFDGGFSPGHNTLELAVNFASNAQALTVTINFAASYTNGVAYVSFNLFDIDFANSSGNTYQDLIKSISATSTTGTSIAPTITGVGANTTLAGTGLTQTLTGNTSTVDTGAGSGNANATITFNATNIKSIAFTYSSTSMFANPTYQHIGIDDITYTVVPEINASWLSLFLCTSLATWSTLRRHKSLGRTSPHRQ